MAQEKTRVRAVRYKQQCAPCCAPAPLQSTCNGCQLAAMGAVPWPAHVHMQQIKRCAAVAVGARGRYDDKKSVREGRGSSKGVLALGSEGTRAEHRPDSEQQPPSAAHLCHVVEFQPARVQQGADCGFVSSLWRGAGNHCGLKKFHTL